MKKLFFKKSNAFFTGGLVDFGLGILLVLVVAALAANYFLTSRSSSNILQIKSDVLQLSSKVSTLFGGSSGYGGLENNVAIEGGAVPSGMLKGSNIVNAWGGEVILSPSDDESSFFIELTDIPDKECTQIVGDQEGSWISVAVNGTELSDASPADIIGLCSNGENTIRYEAR